MSDGMLKGRIVLITGCTGGIGKATARTLAKQGCSIAVHYNSDAKGAEALTAELRDVSPEIRVEAFQADLSSYDGARALHASVITKLGPIDVLFANAGVTHAVVGRHGNIGDVSPEMFEATWRTNTGTAFLLAQLCMPHMLQQKWGRIVFCSSVAAGTGGVVGPHYASSKAALHGLIHWIAQRYARDGITCNGVAPALIVGTNMLPAAKPEYEALIPVGRLGQPAEIAAIVEMLVTNAYMTNKIIVADGGWTGTGF